MLETTFDAVRAVLRSDPTVSPVERSRLLALLRQSPPAKTETPVEMVPRVLRRNEVAQRLSCSLRTVDKLPLAKVILPGRKRAAGFREAEVNALIAGSKEGI